jgi:hypothetical protein
MRCLTGTGATRLQSRLGGKQLLDVDVQTGILDLPSAAPSMAVRAESSMARHRARCGIECLPWSLALLLS